MRRHLFFVAVMPLLASCALGPKVATPNLTLPTAFESQPTAGPEATPIDRWWVLYNDPQLEGLVDQALVNAPDARSAYARLKEARAVRSDALSPYWPQGALKGSATRNDTLPVGASPTIDVPTYDSTGKVVTGVQKLSLLNAGSTDNYGVNFDVTWELDVLGGRNVSRKKANADLATAKFDFEASRTSLAANVADQLFQARGLAIQLEDARQEARIDQNLLDVAQKKASHGLGPQSDADEAASQASQAEAQVADLETQLHAAKRTLLVLVGRGAEPVANLDTAADVGTPPPIPASVPGQLLARRPDVREAAEKLISAKGMLKLDELAMFPNFTLQPGVGLTEAPVLGAMATSNLWSIGVNVAQPILDLPRLKAEIRAQGARADQAVIAYEKAVQTAYGESDNALVQLGSDETRVRILTAGEAQGLSAYKASKTRYGAGIDDLSTVLTAERTWRAARTALTAAQVQAMRRSVQAFKALGGGWSATELAAETHGAR